MHRTRLTFATLVVGFATTVALSGCDRKAEQATVPSGSATPTGAPSASASAAVVNALPSPEDEVRKFVNPGNEPPYSGPTGTVRGTVAVKGDPAPVLEQVAEKIPDRCKDARFVYGRLFREGMVRSLADALVTVTGYKGYLPAKEAAVRVQAKDCAFQRRTVAMMFGQRLEVVSKDRESYVPKLLGGKMAAEMVAVPGGDPAKLYPHVPGRYTLIDSMHLWMTAEVFVLKYPTATVTDLDGKFEITGVPVGEVTVSALLPATMQAVQKNVKIEAGKTVDVELELEFKREKAAADAGAKPKIVIH